MKWGPNGDLFQQKWGPKKYIFQGSQWGFECMLCLKELGLGEESYLIYFINMTISLFNLPRQEFLDCGCYHCEKSIVFKVTIAID